MVKQISRTKIELSTPKRKGGTNKRCNLETTNFTRNYQHISIAAGFIAIKAYPIMKDVLRFVHLEEGHATQNFFLQPVEFGLGTTTITSFDLKKIYEVLKLPLNHRPIYILPIGSPKRTDII